MSISWSYNCFLYRLWISFFVPVIANASLPNSSLSRWVSFYLFVFFIFFYFWLCNPTSDTNFYVFSFLKTLKYEFFNCKQSKSNDEFNISFSVLSTLRYVHRFLTYRKYTTITTTIICLFVILIMQLFAIFTKAIFKPQLFVHTQLHTRLSEFLLTAVYIVLPSYSPTWSVKRTLLKQKVRIPAFSRTLYQPLVRVYVFSHTCLSFFPYVCCLFPHMYCLLV